MHPKEKILPIFKKGLLFHGWWIAFTALAVNSILSAPTYGGTGLWIDSLENHFGWTRTQLSIAFSLGQLEGSIVSPFVGYLIDRYGGKKISICGVIIASFGFICLSQTINLTSDTTSWIDPLIFYVSYMIIMLGVSLGGWIPMTVILNNWFTKNKSLAMSMGSVGFAVGTFIFVPIIAAIITPDRLGWRLTAIIVSIFFCILIVPILKIVKDTPKEFGLVPDGEENTTEHEGIGASSTNSPTDFSLGEALKEKVFWYVAIGQGASAMMTTTMMVHLILAFKDQGISLQSAAVIWGIAMGIGGVAQVIGGIVGDRTPKRFAACGFGCLQAIGVALAVVVDSYSMALVFAVIYGVGYGARAPVTTSMRGEYFGRKSFGKIMGISAVPLMIMTMIAPVFAGRSFDSTGDYTTSFLWIALFGFIGSLIFLIAKKPLHPSLKHTLK